MYLRVFFYEKLRDVNLLQGVTCSKVNILCRSQEGDVPNAPGGVDKIRARVFGTIDIDRPVGPQNHTHSCRKRMHVPEETTNSSLP